MALGRDVDFHDRSLRLAYVDRRTRDVIRLYEEDYNAATEAGIPEDENRRAANASRRNPSGIF